MKKPINYRIFLFSFLLLSNCTFDQNIELSWIKPGGGAGFAKILFSGDSSYFVTVDRNLRIWNLKNFEYSASLTREMSMGSHEHNFPIKITNDSKFICYQDGSHINIWDVKKNSVIRQFKDAGSTIQAINITSDDMFLVACDENNWIYLWELGTGKFITKTESSAKRIYRIDFINNEKQILIKGFAGESKFELRRLNDLTVVKNFDFGFINFFCPNAGTEIIMTEKPRTKRDALISGYRVLEFNTGKLLNDHFFEDYGPHDKFIIDDGNALVADHNFGGKLTKYSLPSFTKEFYFEKYNIHRMTNEIIRQKNLLVAILEYGGIGVWSTEDGKFLYSFAENEKELEKLVISPDNNYLFSTDMSGNYIIWDFNNRIKIKQLTGHTYSVISVKNVLKYNYTISLDNMGTLVIWDTNTGEKIFSLSLPPHRPDTLPAKIKKFEISSDQNNMALYVENYDFNGKTAPVESTEIVVYDLMSLKKWTRLEFSKEIRDLKFIDSQDIKFISEGHQFYSWTLNTANASIDTSLELYSFSPRGNYVYSYYKGEYYSLNSAGKGNLNVYNLAENKYVFKQKIDDQGFGPVSFSDDEKFVATTTRAGKNIKIWDTETGDLEHSIEYNGHGAWNSTISPSGKYFAGTSLSGDINIWDIDNSELIIHEKYGAYHFTSLSWSPDEKYINIGTYGGTVMLWKFNKP